ncbi:hypothetical protein CsSME_00010250 [Camellia sinensis var. sinensis]
MCLFSEGHSDVPPTKSTMSCSIHGHRSPVGSMIDHARHQQQDHADPSGVHPHQPSLRYSQSYHPQQRPCQCQLSSDQHHTCQPKAGTNGVSAGMLWYAMFEVHLGWLFYYGSTFCTCSRCVT